MSIVKQLQEYSSSLYGKTKEFVEELTKRGEETAQKNLDNADYSGTLQSKITSVARGRQGFVFMLGRDAGMIEFGAGTQYPDIHPQAEEMGAIRGFYKGRPSRGLNPRWSFTSGESGSTAWQKKDYQGEPIPNEYVTMGTPANRVMYNTARELERTYVNIAKEVFKK